MQTEPSREALRDQGRLVLAFFMLPVLDAAVAFLFGLATIPVFWPNSIGLVDSARSMALGIGFTAIPVTAVLVFPTVLVLIGMGPVSLRQLAIAGGLIGLAPYLLVIALSYLNIQANPLATARDAYKIAILGSVLGMTSGAVFWLIGIRGSRYDAHRVPAG